MCARDRDRASAFQNVKIKLHKEQMTTLADKLAEREKECETLQCLTLVITKIGCDLSSFPSFAFGALFTRHPCSIPNFHYLIHGIRLCRISPIFIVSEETIASPH